jgi:hypothetical protein
MKSKGKKKEECVVPMSGCERQMDYLSTCPNAELVEEKNEGNFERTFKTCLF